MYGMSSSSGFNSGSYSQEYDGEVKKIGGKRKNRVTRRLERGGQQFRGRAGGKRCTKRRGGKKCRSKKNIK